MSLDGFIADPDGNVGPLFDWYRNGDVEVPLPGYGLTFHMTEASARYWTETVPTEEGAQYVNGRCAAREHVVYRRYPGADHGSIAGVAINDVLPFFAGALKGSAPAATC
jgi:hypothetical protein